MPIQRTTDRLYVLPQVKFPGYLRAHQAGSNLSVGSLSRAFEGGCTLNDVMGGLVADEFADWVREKWAVFEAEFEQRYEEVRRIYEGMNEEQRGSRKVFARVAGPHRDKAALFKLDDGEDDAAVVAAVKIAIGKTYSKSDEQPKASESDRPRP